MLVSSLLRVGKLCRQPSLVVHSQSLPRQIVRVVSLSYASSAGEPAAPPKAAALIIGNEILSGSITDTNTPWLAKLLYSRGVDLLRVEYIPDDIEDIRATVLRLKETVGDDGVIFTSGGIGPTHDDVTYEALAAAFGKELALHEPTVQRMKQFYDKRGIELNEARLRMATLPKEAEVLYTEGLWVPLVNLESVYILPGIPRLFTASIEAHKERFTGRAHHFSSLYTTMGEGDLADILTSIAAKHQAVRIGSYPNTAGDSGMDWRVKLNFESRDEAALAEAVESAKSQLTTVELAGSP